MTIRELLQARSLPSAGGPIGQDKANRVPRRETEFDLIAVLARQIRDWRTPAAPPETGLETGPDTWIATQEAPLIDRAITSGAASGPIAGRPGYGAQTS